jgi:hypothetical protein
VNDTIWRLCRVAWASTLARGLTKKTRARVLAHATPLVCNAQRLPGPPGDGPPREGPPGEYLAPPGDEGLGLYVGGCGRDGAGGV